MKKRKGRNFVTLVLLAALVFSLTASAATTSLNAPPRQTDDVPPEESSPSGAVQLNCTPAPEEIELPAIPPVPLNQTVRYPVHTLEAVEAVVPAAALASITMPRTAPVMTISRTTGSHLGYISGVDGAFLPEQAVTRAELAQILSGIVTDTPATVSYFYDVSWNLPAVQKVVGLGLMDAPNGFFRPNDPATHAECAYALSLMLPYSATGSHAFPDVSKDHWAYEAISRGGGCGLFKGDANGYFHPENPLKRSELVVMVNRVLGRTPDQAFLSQLPAFQTFSDVPATHWAYWDILEATVPHTCQLTADGGEKWLWADMKFTQDGPYRISGRLYWVQNGEFVRDQSIGYLYFDANGRYTTGSADLDTRLNNIIERLTNNTMTRDQKLRVLFNYCRDNYTYLKRPLIAKGQTGWEPEYALFFLNYGKGNCYCFSATYCLLCRNLGLQAYTVVGRALNSPHGWVEINLDGATYLFDTQLEWRYLHDWGMRGYNFFKQPYYNTTVAYSR